MVSFSIPGSRLGFLRQAGFTLVELMVAMGVMAVIMAIAVPTIATYTARQEIRGSAQQVVDVLREARDSAINEGEPRYVRFIAGNPGRYEVRWYDGDDWLIEEQEALHDSVTFGNADVTFPAVPNEPETGEQIPQYAAYFDTRGHYPFGMAATYSLTLHGGMNQTETITLHTQTGQVTWG
jgi:type II secretion system protein H